MKKIGLATPSWNSEMWIYPFLKLTEGLDKRVIVQGKEPVVQNIREYGVSNIPDKSEEMIRRYFPDVEIIYHNTNKFGSPFWNFGHKYLSKDCDFIFRLDTDEMIHPDLWQKMIEFVREDENMDSMAIDFGKAIMYDKDLNHGFRNPNEEWIETRGLNAKHVYQNFGAFLGSETLIIPKIGELHHYKGMKGNNKNNGLYETPKWLRDLFEEGWQKLKEL